MIVETGWGDFIKKHIDSFTTGCKTDMDFWVMEHMIEKFLGVKVNLKEIQHEVHP
jgi:hypothetical protein